MRKNIATFMQFFSAKTMGNKDQWFETWFDSPYYHILYDHRDEAEAGAFIDVLVDHLKIPLSSNILDLACGNGRHSQLLAKKGLQVTGIDLSKNSIEKAQQLKTHNLQFYDHDMRNVFRKNAFDYIFSFFTSFGYFELPSEHIQTFQSIGDGLKNQGVLMLDYLNTFTAKRELVVEETITKSNIQFKIKREFHNNTFIKEIQFSDGGSHFNYVEKVKGFIKEDFFTYCQGAGLKVLNLFGDYKMTPFDEDTSDRLILIAQKEV